mmetsp:Transcript_3506/g.5265  ORF Transcript_3506/g.5265 Transcript_3506/m.5265 type:complete len:242 (-) Transcript_3506:581-1306(-)
MLRSLRCSRTLPRRTAPTSSCSTAPPFTPPPEDSSTILPASPLKAAPVNTRSSMPSRSASACSTFWTATSRATPKCSRARRCTCQSTSTADVSCRPITLVPISYSPRAAMYSAPTSGRLVPRRRPSRPIWISLTTRVCPSKKRETSRTRLTASLTTALASTSPLWTRQRPSASTASTSTRVVWFPETSFAWSTSRASTLRLVAVLIATAPPRSAGSSSSRASVFRTVSCVCTTLPTSAQST